LHFLGEYHEASRVLLDAREMYKDQVEISYRLGGLFFLVQKDKEALFFLETGLKADFNYLKEVQTLFPSIFEKPEVQDMIERFKPES